MWAWQQGIRRTQSLIFSALQITCGRGWKFRSHKSLSDIISNSSFSKAILSFRIEGGTVGQRDSDSRELAAVERGVGWGRVVGGGRRAREQDEWGGGRRGKDALGQADNHSPRTHLGREEGEKKRRHQAEASGVGREEITRQVGPLLCHSASSFHILLQGRADTPNGSSFLYSLRQNETAALWVFRNRRSKKRQTFLLSDRPRTMSARSLQEAMEWTGKMGQIEGLTDSDCGEEGEKTNIDEAGWLARTLHKHRGASW